MSTKKTPYSTDTSCNVLSYSGMQDIDLYAFYAEDDQKSSVCLATIGMCPASFYFPMTPEGARGMAAQLIRIADVAERIEIEATMQAELTAEQAAA